MAVPNFGNIHQWFFFLFFLFSQCTTSTIRAAIGHEKLSNATKILLSDNRVVVVHVKPLFVR